MTAVVTFPKPLQLSGVMTQHLTHCIRDCISCESPRHCWSLPASLFRRVSCFDSNIWEQHRYEIVLAGTRLKFSCPELRALLINTHPCTLAEAAPHDKVWGIELNQEQALSGAPWQGTNLLGESLMQVRNEVRTSSTGAGVL
jgi:ribA/ribD-fused uncharacterized protein